MEDHEIQRLVQHPNSEFWKQNPYQNLCSHNLPATPPQQNLVSGMLLVCNRILRNMWISMTNICSMTEHGVLFCNISDLFPQRKNLWIFFSRNSPATTVSQIVSWLCPLATYLPHATISMVFESSLFSDTNLTIHQYGGGLRPLGALGARPTVVESVMADGEIGGAIYGRRLGG